MGIPGKKLFSLLPAALLFWLTLQYLLPVFFPFLLGAGIALLAEPIVRLLAGKLRVPRAAAAGIGVSMVFALICMTVTCLFAFLFRELGVLAGILPDMETALRDGLGSLQNWLMTLSRELPTGFRPLIQRNLSELFSSGSALLDRAVRYALGLAGTLLGHLPDSALGLGTAVLSAFLISAKLPQLGQQLQNRFPSQRLQKAADLWQRFKSTVLLWLLAQAKLTGVTCLILSAGLLLLRIPYAPLWALGISAVDAFPILGTGTILLPWSVVCLLQQDSPRALGLLGLYAVTALTRSLLEPKILGSQLGLDPLVTLIALYTGFRFWGVGGMILMPMAAMTAVGILNDTAKQEE